MKTYFVYMLRCSDDSFYIGITNDVRRRLAEHISGTDLSCYTFRRKPLTLVYNAEFHDARCAIAFEKQIKRWSRKKKEALICKNEEALHELAECKNETHTRNKPK